jgi:hypothetical protein
MNARKSDTHRFVVGWTPSAAICGSERCAETVFEGSQRKPDTHRLTEMASQETGCLDTLEKCNRRRSWVSGNPEDGCLETRVATTSTTVTTGAL